MMWWILLAGFGALGLMILSLRQTAKQAGKLEAVNESHEQVQEDIKQAKRVSRAITSLPADEKRKLLKRKWTRKKRS